MGYFIIAIIVIAIILIFRQSREHFDQGQVIPGPLLSYYERISQRSLNQPGAWPGPKKIVVGLHYTTWCPHCKLVRPIWESLKVSLADKPIVFVENDEQFAHTEGISAIPTIIKYSNGVGEQYIGTLEYEPLRQWITKAPGNIRQSYFGY